MRPNPTQDQIALIKPIQLLVMDVDGILTEGNLSFLADGSEIKSFNILDGLGIKLLMESGVKTAIITGRQSNQVIQRAESLGINYIQQGREDKLTALQELWKNTGYNASNTAYIGDDLPDLSAIVAARFGVTVPNGHWLVKENADHITTQSGGRGAARELCELIMACQGTLDNALERFK
ncbi:3-deoxy-D-manno-octulosonate 8-phosphate phosphatase KdsC [Marinobacterium sp. xm-a-121]|uniref:KdsC family phosphatase n=1 Tax=unclassified Marinobacterium TaxID=2644139 RepID=UPI001568B731|nr:MULTISPECIES: HAD hydrolase family protein [unclassified Marinobacterium]NRP37821.1 3-deoxy-D-manno-octulosonate 8-phosphate phosphatase KdsC [Marinobacterium sp. xm-a-121]NRP52760.1 3-deoxy-D-manno-octulosonate 8-phosphate phosphatase KdsC [Marinobacterium sp. xm-v-242]NRP77341.1 3-deoxy-D-manno-octulosonate 8-phosphate phosphatase KdsC [Marinobacterium sp. xm-m-383]NRP99073.1 3-deoxy-D-manno-octulosonate 8-phosphate phosphatase KdsC [Marinobacterium sp. xm-v-233]